MKDKNTLKTIVLVNQLLGVDQNHTNIVLDNTCCCGRAVVSYAFHFSD